MALSISRLRVWFAVLALAAVAVVAGFYIHARWEFYRTLRNLPGKVGIGIQQTSEGFTFSKSEGGRTLFTIHASKATQFQQGGRAALHDVRIVVYGRRSDRFDQIYGSDFEYDPGTATVSSRGEVQMDLQSRTEAGQEPLPRDAGGAAMAKAPPKPTEGFNGPPDKGPDGAIHLRAKGLVFDQKRGVAESQGRVEFRLPQAEGTAHGAFYDSKKNELTLRSGIDMQALGRQPTHIVARSATLSKDPRVLTLDVPEISGAGHSLAAGKAVAYMGEDNTLQRVVAEGNVRLGAPGRTLLADKAVAQFGPGNSARRVEALGNVQLSEAGGLHLRAPKGELLLGAQGAARSALESAWFGGGVDFESGAQGSAGHAGEMRVLFAPPSTKGGRTSSEAEPRTIMASQGVVLRQSPREGVRNPQLTTMTAGAMTFALEGGSPLSQVSAAQGAPRGIHSENLGHPATKQLRLSSAETEGPGELTIQAANSAPADVAASGVANAKAGASAGGQTVIDARQFRADFGEDSRLRTLHGKGAVQIVSRASGEPDKVSTSETLVAEFSPSGEIARAVQEGSFRYREQQGSSHELGGRRAAAARANYSPLDDSLTLAGEPRVVDGGLTVEADNIRLQRRSGELSASGNVKTTYSQLTAQPGGALLAASEPVHVTAHAMNALRASGLAHYTGGARLWQGSNVVEAQGIDFDEKARTILASGDTQHPVTCVFTQSDARSKAGTMLVTAPKLSYDDTQRQAHYWGGVTAKSADGMMTAERADLVLSPANNAGGARGTSGSRSGSTSGPNPGPSQLERIVASTRVVVQQGARRVVGEKLVYDVPKGIYVMTGGPPMLSDAVNGTVHGDSLTFYSRDDRVVVEGGDASRAVTHTHLSR